LSLPKKHIKTENEESKTVEEPPVQNKLKVKASQTLQLIEKTEQRVS